MAATTCHPVSSCRRCHSLIRRSRRHPSQLGLVTPRPPQSPASKLNRRHSLCFLHHPIDSDVERYLSRCEALILGWTVVRYLSDGDENVRGQALLSRVKGDRWFSVELAQQNLSLTLTNGVALVLNLFILYRAVPIHVASDCVWRQCPKARQ
jgi:hypothetical protein